MFLKVDHISYSTTFEKDISKFILQGYRNVFVEENLKNLPCKGRFLSEPLEWHTIELYDSDEDVPIEVTRYKTTYSGRTNMVRMGFNRFKVCVADLEDSRKFFKLLGFKETGNENVIACKYPLDKQTLTFELSLCAHEWKLDTEGFSSLAILDNKISKTREKFRNAGYYVSDIENLIVNNKEIRICFIAGPGSEIIEIIEV